MSADAKPAGWRPGASLMAAPVLVYFLFPHLYLLPFVLAGRSLIPPPPGMKALFAPISFLAETFPPYAALLHKESQWTDIY